MKALTIDHTVVERFLKYVTFDTQSSEESKTYPSTEKQKKLGEFLVQELKEMGITDASMDNYGYVSATLPANMTTAVPVIGLIAHMDTSPDVSGENVKAVIHKNYHGQDIVLPGDEAQVIRFARIRNWRSRSETTSSPPTERHCWELTTKRESPRSWTPSFT